MFHFPFVFVMDSTGSQLSSKALIPRLIHDLKITEAISYHLWTFNDCGGCSTEVVKYTPVKDYNKFLKNVEAISLNDGGDAKEQVLKGNIRYSSTAILSPYLCERS